MDREVKIESIRALERLIKEGKGDIIELKRVRNSLLNISTRFPPEILGDIFSWTLAREDPVLALNSHFEGFPKRSYNFFLVCYHWFEVASNIPTLLELLGKYFKGMEGMAPSSSPSRSTGPRPERFCIVHHTHFR